MNRESAVAALSRPVMLRTATLATPHGLTVRVHLSWLLVCGLIVWVLVDRFATLLWPFGWAGIAGAVAVGVTLALASLLARDAAQLAIAHELGLRPRSLTFALVGGTVRGLHAAPRPRDAAAVAAAGPFTNLALASASGLIYSIAPAQNPFGVVTGYLAWTNFFLGMAALVPALPLDGGRLVSAVAWALGARPARAARATATGGIVVALALLAAGVYGMAGGPQPLITGPLLYAALLGLTNWVFTLLAGGFLLQAAWQARRWATWRQALASTRVRDLMRPLPSDVSGADAPGPPGATGVAMSVTPAAELLTDHHVDADEAAESLTDHHVEADESAEDALDRLLESPGESVLVTELGRPVGLLVGDDVRGVGR
ncbi:hypothetical protein ER308_07805 [Egibacter rhizosphaerae]|uniref:Peptidase M50 domain-containing protein n=1 Tax=Egibacter rhizosphaerae TaxID=1670831 RepID=A0A411YE27_9ACTN|nr:site-2 protease family protein [Egibacter rhizosphaerae]QBI19465.1 hypothetical protein ER308_07805 [Egibacter rhizosphaerae]